MVFYSAIYPKYAHTQYISLIVVPHWKYVLCEWNALATKHTYTSDLSQMEIAANVHVRLTFRVFGFVLFAHHHHHHSDRIAHKRTAYEYCGCLCGVRAVTRKSYLSCQLLICISYGRLCARFGWPVFLWPFGLLPPQWQFTNDCATWRLRVRFYVRSRFDIVAFGRLSVRIVRLWEWWCTSWLVFDQRANRPFKHHARLHFLSHTSSFRRRREAGHVLMNGTLNDPLTHTML